MKAAVAVVLVFLLATPRVLASSLFKDSRKNTHEIAYEAFEKAREDILEESKEMSSNNNKEDFVGWRRRKRSVEDIRKSARISKSAANSFYKGTLRRAIAVNTK